MRFREQDNTEPYVCDWTKSETMYDGTVVNTSGSESFGRCHVGTYRSILDTVTPRFKERSANGEVIVNPMKIFEETLSVEQAPSVYRIDPPQDSEGLQPYTSAQSRVPGMMSFAGLDHPGHQPLEIHGSVLNTLAGTRAAARVDNPEFEGAVFIAELRETLQFLKNPLQGWVDFLRDLRKKKNRNRLTRRQTVGKFLGDNHLAYRYAVRPIVSDTEAAAKAVARVVADYKPKRKTARASASNEAEVVIDAPTEGLDPLASYVLWRQTTKRSRTVRAGILYEYSRDPNTFGVELGDVPAAIWEATWASFVADWFANIGDWIRAITPIMGVKRLGSWTTSLDKRETEIHAWWANGGYHESSGNFRSILSDASTVAKLTTTIKERSPGISVGLAPTELVLDGSKLGIERLLDLVYLSGQLIKSR